MQQQTLRSRIRRTVGNVFVFLTGTVVTISALVKFAGVPAVVHKMENLGFSGGKLMLVAVLELMSAAAFLYRPTRAFGLLFLSAFLGGAICSHVRVAAYADAVGPAIILGITWVSTWLRHPQSLWNTALESEADSNRQIGNSRWAPRTV
jgi:hypothetical protein